MATGFAGFGPAPIDPALLSATVTFDPSVTTMTSTAGVTLNSTNLTTDFPFSFAYWTSNDTLYFGGSNGGAEGLFTDTTDFFVAILHPLTDPTISWVEYNTSPDASAGNLYGTHAGTVSVTPEPATWAMLITGMFSAGIMLRRRGPAATAHA